MKILSNCIGVGALLFAVLTVSAKAESYDIYNVGACDPCGLGCYDINCGKKAKNSLWDYGGWIEAGIYGNNLSSRNVYYPSGSMTSPYLNGPGEAWYPLSGNSYFLGPARMVDLQMNQTYGYFGKKLDTRHGWDIGGRVDIMYGTDAFYTQSNGLEYGDTHKRWGEGDYLLSLPQLYAEIGYRNLSLKAGKFYTPLGHESIMSTGRFFYSTSYATSIVTPITQTGVLATWDANSRLSVFGGWTNGEDYSQGVYGKGAWTFAGSNNNAALFGFKYKVNRKINFGYSALVGKEKDFWGTPGATQEYFVHSLIVNIQPNSHWDYTFAWTLRDNEWEGMGANPVSNFYGINQELIYKYNSCWAIGLRGEWMYSSLDESLCEVTLGANWTPNNWLLVRPEVRYDYCSADGGVYMFNNYSSKDQFGFGVSTVVKF